MWGNNMELKVGSYVVLKQAPTIACTIDKIKIIEANVKCYILKSFTGFKETRYPFSGILEKDVNEKLILITEVDFERLRDKYRRKTFANWEKCENFLNNNLSIDIISIHIHDYPNEYSTYRAYSVIYYGPDIEVNHETKQQS